MEENNKQKEIALFFGISAFAIVTIFGGLYYYQLSSSARKLSEAIRSFEDGRLEDSKSKLEQILQYDSNNAAAYSYLGLIELGEPAPEDASANVLYRQEADYKKAIEHLKKALDLNVEKTNPGLHRRVLFEMGVSYQGLNEKDKANQYFTELIGKYPPGNFVARYFLAKNYFERTDKAEEALELLEPAIGAAEAHPFLQKRLYRSYVILTRLYVYMGDYEKAEEYALLAIQNAGDENKDTPEIRTAHLLLVITAGAKKDFSFAEQKIKELNEQAGYSESRQCALAEAYAIGENYTKALEVAKRVEPREGYLYSLCLAALANSSLKLNQIDDAKKYMEQYLSLTDGFEEKNIFVHRNQKKFSSELQN